MRASESVISADNALRVTLVAYDRVTGAGRIRIEALSLEPGWFFVTLKYGEAGEHAIVHRTFGLHKTSEYPFHANRSDAMRGIDIVRIPLSSDRGVQRVISNCPQQVAFPATRD